MSGYIYKDFRPATQRMINVNMKNTINQTGLCYDKILHKMLQKTIYCAMTTCFKHPC